MDKDSGLSKDIQRQEIKKAKAIIENTEGSFALLYTGKDSQSGCVSCIENPAKMLHCLDKLRKILIKEIKDATK